jgi:hypothetical protein
MVCTIDQLYEYLNFRGRVIHAGNYVADVVQHQTVPVGCVGLTHGMKQPLPWRQGLQFSTRPNLHRHSPVPILYLRRGRTVAVPTPYRARVPAVLKAQLQLVSALAGSPSNRRFPNMGSGAEEGFQTGNAGSIPVARSVLLGCHFPREGR